jgi:hypothetical protein
MDLLPVEYRVHGMHQENNQYYTIMDLLPVEYAVLLTRKSDIDRVIHLKNALTKILCSLHTANCTSVQV